MPLEVYRQYSFRDGLDTTRPASEISQASFSGGRNTRLDGDALIRRGGQTKLNSSAVQSGAPVHSLFRFYKDDSSTRYTIAFAGTRMLNMSASPSNWESSPTSFSNGVQMGGGAFGNAFYFGNGVDGMKKTTAPNSISSVSGAPNAGLIAVSTTANRIFALVGKNLYYSAQGNGDDWSTANDAGVANIPFSDGENGTAIYAMQNGVVAIFSRSSFHTLTGTDPGNFNRREIDPSVGCRAPRSIAAGRGGIYFLGNDNRVYWTNGNSPIPVSYNVDSLLMSGSIGEYDNAIGWVEGSRYHLAFPMTGSTNNVVLVKDWKSSEDSQAGWVLDDSINAISVAVDDGVDGQVLTGDYSGFVQQQDIGSTDNGTDIEAYVTTRDNHHKEPERVKKSKRIRSKWEPSGNYSADVAVSTDGSSLVQQNTIPLNPNASVWGSFNWGETEWGGSADHTIVKTTLIKRYRSLKLRFSVSNEFKFFGYSLYFTRRFNR